MTKKPTLIIMAAGMGSRYGGLKQIAPVTDFGEIIIDFSLYDAVMAGFDKAVFIIKKEMEEDMRALIDDGAGKHIDVEYVFQEMADLPVGYAVPDGREKPWGTGHAVLSARNVVDGPFAAINADDYYGPAAYQLMYEYLSKASDDAKLRYAMIGYRLSNTVTEHGSVARGVCRLAEGGDLVGIDERLKIERRDDGIAYEAEGGKWIDLAADATVSMNFWGFTESFMGKLEAGIEDFFKNDVPKNTLKSEYLLPRIIDKLLNDGTASVKVMESVDRWYGVTYKEDKEQVVAALRALKDKGVYPDKLWR